MESTARAETRWRANAPRVAQIAGDGDSFWAGLLSDHADEVWRRALAWCRDPVEAADAVEMTWLRVGERLDVWLAGIPDRTKAAEVLHVLVVGTTVEECIRQVRLGMWREQVEQHAQGA